MRISAPAFIVLFAASLMFFPGCAAPEKPPEATTPTPRAMTEFEREIKAMKTAKFDYIYVFKRRDGGVLTDEDKQFIREKSHYATNRFSLSKDGTTVFAGSNFKFDDDSLKDLKERFDFQDFSKPAEELQKKRNPGSNTGGNKDNSGTEP